MVLFLLSESASGYGLMEVVEADDIASGLPEVQAAITEFVRFSKMVKLRAFAPFTSAEHALENINMISEGLASPYLENFLTSNLPKASKKDSQYTLGVHREPKFKSSVADVIGKGIQVLCDERTEELLRGVRMHFERFIDALNPGDLHTSQLGLAHSYSRSKVKFNPHKSDNMIIQSIALLDQLDKDINTFAMRVREWYSWHFPELLQVVPDNIQYAKLVRLIKNKKSLLAEDGETGDTELVNRLNEVIMDEDKCHDVIEAARSSMGTDVSPIDLINIESFASRVVSLAEYRASLHAYLQSKMHVVAPNLAALIGEQVGARLIAHAGSLTSLAKYPASTVQILGAEKALFRALKTKSKTPKYGLLFHSTFIGRAKMKNKGRISRYLANKCSIASRVDCFGEGSTDIFGIKLRDQVEERLKFFDSGAAPRKNIDVMREATKQARAEMPDDGDTEMVDAQQANGNGATKDDDDGNDGTDDALKTPEKRKKKTDKKSKKGRRLNTK
eukprot:Plantae.Rhodophyta-Hildenbrandia_rubra.ctg4165.p1 GENE.Plantae.Rhodophyta-Hildenbrandia_rubra.ctg4165~~Plantae.Rhodophyta-Hildenbrandia_rubra.ctg4165.p1  ORF type:complete len:503 (-),score=107.39 Plantae.Rhodophyta-Hildenbrandia_rubra.ctg4165:81-1589(-)